MSGPTEIAVPLRFIVDALEPIGANLMLTNTFSRRTLIAGGLALAVPTISQADSRFKAAAAYSAGSNGVSMAVMEKGKLIFEDYPNGGGPQKFWELASGTKSFSGIIAAAASKDGFLSLDEKAADTLPEWRDGTARTRITIRHILTLTSGIGGGGIGRPPFYADAIQAPATSEAGTVFAYGPTPYQIFGEIMRRKLGAKGRPSDPLAYLTRRIFDPLSIRPGRWMRGADGNPHLPSGAALTARDWIKFGQTVLDAQNGKDRLGLDPAVLGACFIGTKANPGYGLTWWIPGPGMKGPGPRSPMPIEGGEMAKSGRIWMAAGAGNQRLYLLPERDLIIVRQADRILDSMMGNGPKWSDAEFLRMALA